MYPFWTIGALVTKKIISWTTIEPLSYLNRTKTGLDCFGSRKNPLICIFWNLVVWKGQNNKYHDNPMLFQNCFNFKIIQFFHFFIEKFYSSSEITYKSDTLSFFPYNC